MKAFAAAGIMVLSKSIYYLTARLVLIYDYFYDACRGGHHPRTGLPLLQVLRAAGQREEDQQHGGGRHYLHSAVFVLLIGGIGIEYVAVFSLIYLGALFITLIIGYKIGIMEGGVSGIASGMTVMFLTAGSPAVIGIFACAGMTAGFFKGLSRIVAGVCFAAVCIAFGLIRGYPELYISIYDPLLAAAVFIAIPRKWMGRIELLLAQVRKDHIYEELAAKDRMLLILGGYLETFEKLAALYRGGRSRSSIISMQFKGMAKVTRT